VTLRHRGTPSDGSARDADSSLLALGFRDAIWCFGLGMGVCDFDSFHGWEAGINVLLILFACFFRLPSFLFSMREEFQENEQASETLNHFIFHEHAICIRCFSPLLLLMVLVGGEAQNVFSTESGVR
jgi:hypothetical protein